jgi:hypothetical protein
MKGSSTIHARQLAYNKSQRHPGTCGSSNGNTYTYIHTQPGHTSSYRNITHKPLPCTRTTCHAEKGCCVSKNVRWRLGTTTVAAKSASAAATAARPTTCSTSTGAVSEGAVAPCSATASVHGMDGCQTHHIPHQTMETGGVKRLAAQPQVSSRHMKANRYHTISNQLAFAGRCVLPPQLGKPKNDG